MHITFCSVYICVVVELNCTISTRYKQDTHSWIGPLRVSDGPFASIPQKVLHKSYSIHVIIPVLFRMIVAANRSPSFIRFLSLRLVQRCAGDSRCRHDALSGRCRYYDIRGDIIFSFDANSEHRILLSPTWHSTWQSAETAKLGLKRKAPIKR